MYSKQVIFAAKISHDKLSSKVSSDQITDNRCFMHINTSNIICHYFPASIPHAKNLLHHVKGWTRYLHVHQWCSRGRCTSDSLSKQFLIKLNKQYFLKNLLLNNGYLCLGVLNQFDFTIFEVWRRVSFPNDTLQYCEAKLALIHNVYASHL